MGDRINSSNTVSQNWDVAARDGVVTQEEAQQILNAAKGYFGVTLWERTDGRNIEQGLRMKGGDNHDRAQWLMTQLDSAYAARSSLGAGIHNVLAILPGI